MRTTADALARHLVEATVATVEATEAGHLAGWRLPRAFAGHQVGADVRADLCYTLHHLAEAGVASVAGRAIDDVLAQLLAEVDGASTHTFFSYRIAEVLARGGPFADNRLLEGLDGEQRRQLDLATDSSDWLELLDAGVLPRNYAAVLARCELGRVVLGLSDDEATLDRLVDRVATMLAENPAGALDDSNDRIGRYDIYTADVWLFCLPLASRLGDLWHRGIDGALDLVRTVGTRDGTAVAWGRSTGDLGAALGLELAALAIGDRRRPREDGLWLRRAADAERTLIGGFGPDGLSSAHRHRSQDAYRGPERRLQLTFDLLAKMAWAATALQRADPALVAAPVADAYPPGDAWVAFEADRPAGVWAHRGRGISFTVPFVGTTRSHYLPAPIDPGTWEVPIDRDLPCWTPLVVHGLKRYTAGGLPASVVHEPGAVTARWDELPVSGRGLDGADPGPALQATRTVRLSIERRTLTMADELTFEHLPASVSIAVPEVVDHPLRVEWSCPTGHAATTITVDGLAEWRTAWSTLARVHQLDLDPAVGTVAYEARVTPLLRVGSTAFGHHYHESLYGPMADRVVARSSPVGWEAVADPGFLHLDLLHLHWPEWLAFDDLDAHRRIIDELRDHHVPVVWTAHNLTPHEKRPEVYEPIYAAWAEAVSGVIHHSTWGERQMRDRYRFATDCRHEVIPHGHFGDLWNVGLPSRDQAERALGLSPSALRIGIVGAPRAEKLVQAVLDGVAASTRRDVELVCWSLGPDDVVPDDPRIAIAERYHMVDRATYARRLATCDVLALVFDPAGEMLATGAAADAIGLGLPALRSSWGYGVEMLGAAGIDVGHRAASIASALDGLASDDLAAARAAAGRRRDALRWGPVATRTADLFERVVLGEP